MEGNESYHIKQMPRMFEQVMQQIMNFMISEHISAGSKIPTERNLSDLLEVSRSSIREGIRILELLGYLESRQVEGTFASDPPPFLIPCQVLNQRIDSQSLQHYYDIFLMCSEQIVMSLVNDEPLRSHFDITFPDETPNFWADFARWITYLGNQMANPLFLALWRNMNGLLQENQFFLNFRPDLQIHTFVDLFWEKNTTKLLVLFQSLKVN
jgi:GntR family transcriptional regulator, transcriptional repressor for pyruvate dehydrogenase complex